MKQRLLFCTDGIFPHAIGGMQRHSSLLLEELARMQTHEITVVHPHKERVFDASLGIREIPLDYTIQGNYLKACHEYSKLVFRVALNEQPDVIYSQGLSIWYGIEDIGNKVIVNPHGLEPFQGLTLMDKLKTYPLRRAERKIFRHAAKVVSLGGRLTDILHREVPDPQRRVVVLPNAVNQHPMPPRNFDKDQLQLLFVGRFAFNKGIDVLMEAVGGLNNEGYKNRLTFNIVGKGPLYEEYIKKYQYPNVNFLGFADDDKLAELYRTNDLFVFPTLFEGMPTVVLEAMATGMPVVVSDTGATRELVDNQNGFLIERGNFRALKWGIQSFYQLDASKRVALSEGSYRKVAERFTWPIVARQHVELFHTFRTSE